METVQTQGRSSVYQSSYFIDRLFKPLTLTYRALKWKVLPWGNIVKIKEDTNIKLLANDMLQRIKLLLSPLPHQFHPLAPQTLNAFSGHTDVSLLKSYKSQNVGLQIHTILMLILWLFGTLLFPLKQNVKVPDINGFELSITLPSGQMWVL